MTIQVYWEDVGSTTSETLATISRGGATSQKTWNVTNTDVRIAKYRNSKHTERVMGKRLLTCTCGYRLYRVVQRVRIWPPYMDCTCPPATSGKGRAVPTIPIYLHLYARARACARACVYVCVCVFITSWPSVNILPESTNWCNMDTIVK